MFQKYQKMPLKSFFQNVEERQPSGYETKSPFHDVQLRYPAGVDRVVKQPTTTTQYFCFSLAFQLALELALKSQAQHYTAGPKCWPGVCLPLPRGPTQPAACGLSPFFFRHSRVFFCSPPQLDGKGVRGLLVGRGRGFCGRIFAPNWGTPRSFSLPGSVGLAVRRTLRRLLGSTFVNCLWVVLGRNCRVGIFGPNTNLYVELSVPLMMAKSA